MISGCKLNKQTNKQAKLLAVYWKEGVVSGHQQRFDSGNIHKQLILTNDIREGVVIRRCLYVFGYRIEGVVAMETRLIGSFAQLLSGPLRTEMALVFFKMAVINLYSIHHHVPDGNQGRRLGVNIRPWGPGRGNILLWSPLHDCLLFFSRWAEFQWVWDLFAL